MQWFENPKNNRGEYSCTLHDCSITLNVCELTHLKCKVFVVALKICGIWFVVAYSHIQLVIKCI